MKFVLFHHSLVSDWNHGGAHFLRGICSELLARGHDLAVYEPADGASRRQLVAGHGQRPLREFEWRFPRLRSRTYTIETLDVDAALDDADVVIVHESSAPDLVARIGRHRRNARYRLLFHDTHHRSVTAPQEMERYDLRDYDGVLAFGEALRSRYVERAWCARAWTWHEAADIHVFRPHAEVGSEGDLVWVGNGSGDDERRRALGEFLCEPVRALGLDARAYGVDYSEPCLADLAGAGIDYRGWLPNWRVPDAFGRFRVTIHVPRSAYARELPGIPTIRVFEALACGIPLVSAPWSDAEQLFTPGRDYLVARDGADMRRKLRDVLGDFALALDLATHGIRTIHARHTCGHRVAELLGIVRELHGDAPQRRAA